MTHLSIEASMNIFLVLVTFLISFKTSAVTLEVTAKNNVLLLHSSYEHILPSTVGKISVDVFDKESIPYKGGAYVISQLFELGGRGADDIEIISESEMKAYGWCFSINGDVPNTMPDMTDVIDQNSKIVWFYAYAHYKNGAWIGQCVRD